jgi:hypothetical protein
LVLALRPSSVVGVNRENPALGIRIQLDCLAK